MKAKFKARKLKKEQVDKFKEEVNKAKKDAEDRNKDGK